MGLLPVGFKRAFRHRDYAQFMKGQTVFVLGFWLRGTALSWLIYSISNSSFYLGLVAACALVPALIFGPLTGILTDKYPKKKIVLYMQILNIVTTVLMFLSIALGIVEIWHIIVASFLFGTSQGIGVPARNALIRDMVGKKDLTSAVPINAAVFNLGALIGPALAGILIPLIGEAGIFALNIFGESFAYFNIKKLKTEGLPDPPVEGVKNSFSDGFKYAYDAKIIYYSLILLCTASVITSPVQVLLPMITSEILNGDSRLFGLLGAMIGIGGFVSSLFLATRTKKDDTIKYLICGNIIITISLCCFAFSNKVLPSLILLFFFGLGVLLQHISIHTLVQFNAPHQYTGRIMAVHSMCLRGMGMVGSGFSAIGGAYLGIQNTLLVSVFVLVLCSSYLLPKLYKETKQVM